jgi:hypothetical protein
MRKKRSVPIIQKQETAEFAVFTKIKPDVLQHIRFDSDQAATTSLTRAMSKTSPEAGWFARKQETRNEARKDARSAQ